MSVVRTEARALEEAERTLGPGRLCTQSHSWGGRNSCSWPPSSRDKAQSTETPAQITRFRSKSRSGLRANDPWCRPPTYRRPTSNRRPAHQSAVPCLHGVRVSAGHGDQRQVEASPCALKYCDRSLAPLWVLVQKQMEVTEPISCDPRNSGIRS